MNAQVPATTTRPQITAGAQVAALVPQTLDEAFRVAQAIAASGMAPRGMDKPEQVMVAIMAGAELGFAPFQSLQSFAVVNGRPTLWGDGLVAVIRRNGCSIREWHEGETAFCEITRPDTGEVITRSFSQDDAVKAGLAGKQGPWQQFPQRMRAMRARSWAGRDGCADMLRGFQIAEEAQDFTETVREVKPATTGMRARLEARAAASEGFSADHVAREIGGAVEPVTDAEAEEVFDAEVEETVVDDQQTAAPSAERPPLTERIARFKETVEAQKTLEGMRKAWSLSGPLRTDIDAADPDEVGTTAELEAWFNDAFAAREDAEKAAQA